MVEPIIAEVALQSLNVNTPMIDYKTSDGEYGRASSGSMNINLELVFNGDKKKLEDLRAILEIASKEGKLYLAQANPDKKVNNDVSKVVKKEEAGNSYAGKEVW